MAGGLAGRPTISVDYHHHFSGGFPIFHDPMRLADLVEGEHV
jgi:hypothetical protein